MTGEEKRLQEPEAEKSQLKQSVDDLKGQLTFQKEKCKRYRKSRLHRVIQLFLFTLKKKNKKKKIAKNQTRGIIKTKSYKKWTAIETILGISTLVLGIFGAYLLCMQNKLIEQQNKRIVQQTYLQEAERRSALVFLMGNIFDEVSSELKDKSNKDGSLSPQLIGRIVALSHSLIPYKSLMGGELSRLDYSIERGQLLITLVNSGINENTLREIYAKSNFTHSYLVDINLSNAYLHGINLTTSIMRDVNLSGADLSYSTLKKVNLIGANLRETVLDYSYIYKSELYNAKLDSTDLTLAQLDTVWVNKRVNIDKSVFTKNFINTSFFGENAKDTIFTFCIKK